MSEQKITIENVRIVHGNPGVWREKVNMRTKQKEIDQKTGQVKMESLCGVAIPKAYFNSHVWPALNAAAAPFHTVNGQTNYPPDFAWKVTDGDGVDPDGKPYSQREGYAGNMILTIKTSAFIPPIYVQPRPDVFEKVDPSVIKCGHTVNVAVQIKHNGNSAGNGAGVYVNPDAYEIVEYTPEIQTGGANPNEVFGKAQRHMQPGGGQQMPQGNNGMPNNNVQQQGNGNAGYQPNANGAPTNAGMPGQGGYAQQAGLNATGYHSNNQPQNNGMPVNNGQPANNGYQQQPQNNGGNLPNPATDFVNNAVNGNNGNQQPQGGFPGSNGQAGNQPQQNGGQGGFPGQTGPR